MTNQTPALDALTKTLDDVSWLISHHPKSQTPTPGAPVGDWGPLLRSCLLLTYAAWEVYVEESLIWVVEQHVAKGDPLQLPLALRSWVAGRAKAAPWDMAGDGWRQVTVDQVTHATRGDGGNVFGLNTANPTNVMKLHRDLLGAAPLLQVRWQKMTNNRVLSELETLVTTRGQIAHKGQTPVPLAKRGADTWREFVLRLATKLDAQLVALT